VRVASFPDNGLISLYLSWLARMSQASRCEPNGSTYFLEKPMKVRMQPSKSLCVAMVGALAFGVAACDLKPSADNPGKIFDSLVENAGRNAEPPAGVAVQNVSQPISPATDAVLAARVKAALSADPGLRSITVDVNAANGVITLYGTADTPARSHQAAMIALNVDGVRSVKNEMVIVKGS